MITNLFIIAMHTSRLARSFFRSARLSALPLPLLLLSMFRRDEAALDNGVTASGIVDTIQDYQ